MRCAHAGIEFNFGSLAAGPRTLACDESRKRHWIFPRVTPVLMLATSLDQLK
jgi:hypothetical protein